MTHLMSFTESPFKIRAHSEVYLTILRADLYENELWPAPGKDQLKHALLMHLICRNTPSRLYLRLLLRAKILMDIYCPDLKSGGKCRFYLAEKREGNVVYTRSERGAHFCEWLCLPCPLECLPMACPVLTRGRTQTTHPTAIGASFSRARPSACFRTSQSTCRSSAVKQHTDPGRGAGWGPLVNYPWEGNTLSVKKMDLVHGNYISYRE